MTEHEQHVIQAMEQYGGSFVAALAGAFRCADRRNFTKLKTAFIEYWAEYEEMLK